MEESIQNKLSSEILEIQRILINVQNDVQSIADQMKSIRAQVDIESMKEIKSILHGTESQGGLRDSVSRLITLIDGDVTRDVSGVRKRMEAIEKDIAELKTQRDRIKWILVGMGVTSVGNLGALISILVNVLSEIK